MKLSLTLAAVVAAAGLALAAATAQDKGKQDAAAMQMPGPGPEHKVLDHWAGSWDATVSMNDGTQTTTSKGSYTARVGLGGMWLTGEFKGEFMGMPFEGRDVVGYDPAKKAYVGVWVDSMTPSMMNFTGTWDAASNTMTSKGLGVDMTGQQVMHVMKTSFRGTDTMVFEMSLEGTPGPMMTIQYKRK